MNIFQILVVLSASLYCASVDIFSAIEELDKLLETQTAIASELPKYIENEKSRIANLERLLKVFQKEDEKAKKDVSNYLENPLNAFRLIKRLAHDLQSQEESLDAGAGSIVKYMMYTSPHLMFASHEDLIGAVQALVRLQKTYQLNVTELSEGRLMGAYSSPMSSEDCFVVGRIIYEETDKQDAYALPWFLEALRKYRDGDQPHDLTEVDLLEYIAYSYNKVGDLLSALDWSFKIVALDPNHSTVRHNIFYYIDSLISDNDKLHIKGDIGEALPNEAIEPSLGSTNWKGHYEALCRGEFQLDKDITKRLFCWYSSKHSPFLKLAPIKVEQLYIEPDVFVFHQVISDSEIQHIKDLARPKLVRALVLGNDSRPVPTHYRISKSSALKDIESPLVARVTQRVADMTGLSMDSAEELQVVNYGIGGQYEAHLDYSDMPQKAFTDGSNRIATVLFYMSEVPQGGATVFTELGLSVFPIKNAALYWLNLHPSGEGDLATRHAACPVLRGSKWGMQCRVDHTVSNKWIHQNGQELIRPCTLEFQPESMVRPIPRPVPKILR